MRKAKNVLVEASVPPVDAVLKPIEWREERQGFTFFITKSFIKIDLYHIVITDGNIELKADVVGRDRLIEFISSFDE